MIAATMTNEPFTKDVIARLLVEKNAALRSLRDRMNATDDEVELIRLSGQAELLSKDIRALIRQGKSLSNL